MVDPEDLEWLSQYKWHLKVTRGTSYAITSSKLFPAQKTQNIAMHTAIMLRHGLIDDVQIIDHIDCCGCNNTKANLRPATHHQNMMNRQKPKSNTSSQFKGVCWSTKDGQWISQMAVNGKHIFLGYYNDEVVAARVYDCFALKCFGDFARINFPTSEPYSEDECKRLRLEHSKQQKITRASGYRGVDSPKEGGRALYSAMVSHENKQFHIGSYKTAYEAAKAHDAYSFVKRGDKIKLNFPDEEIWTIEEAQQRRVHRRKDEIKYRGVVKQGKKYGAQLTINKQFHWLGMHDTPEAAALAYNEAATRLLGDKAKLNIIPQP